jgi:hypothetical protein
MARKDPELTRTTPQPGVVGVPGRTQIAPPVWGEPGPAIPVPPGTRVRPKHIRWAHEESPWPGRLVTAGIAAAVALVAGILIGRFLLP